MAHLHSVYDTDMHFSIDPITRKIKNEASRKTTVMQFDHGSERFTFELPRYIEGHDMLSCNLVEIHYNNIEPKTKKENRGLCEVDDIQVSPASDDVVIFSWLIKRQSTQLAGVLAFCIRFACVTNEVDYEWHTDTYTGISVSSSLHNGEYVVEEYADVLEQWREELFAIASNAGIYVGSGEMPDGYVMQIDAAAGGGIVPLDSMAYWTDKDREELIQEIIAVLGTPVFGTVDENKVITLSGDLVPGTYTLKYEGTDGVICKMADEG